MTEARVKIAGRQSIQDDDLGGDIQACLTRKKEDATLLLFAGSMGSSPARIGRLAIERARRVIEEVVPVASRLPLTQLSQLGDQLDVIAALDELDDLVLVTPGRAAQQVDEAVGVARDEIDRPVGGAFALDESLDRSPPASRRFDVADRRATEHPHGEVLFFGLDPSQRRKQVAPDLDQPH